MKSIKEDFSLMAILLIPVAVAINITAPNIFRFYWNCFYQFNCGSMDWDNNSSYN